FPQFCALAEQAVKLLVDAKRLPGEESPDPLWPVAVENHWAGRLMAFVHKLAQENRPNQRLRADRQTAWKGYRLPRGTTVSALPCGAFEATGLALELVADDIERHGIPVEPVADSSPLALLIEHLDRLATLANAY